MHLKGPRQMIFQTQSLIGWDDTSLQVAFLNVLVKLCRNTYWVLDPAASAIMLNVRMIELKTLWIFLPCTTFEKCTNAR